MIWRYKKWMNAARAGMIVIFLPLAAYAIDIQLGPPPGDLAPDAQNTLTLVAQQFNDTHPGIRAIIAPNNPDFDETTATQSDLGDVLFIPGPSYGRSSVIAAYAERGWLVPLDEKLQAPDVNQQDFFPNLWPMVRYQGQTWAVPLLVRSWGVAVDASRYDPEQVRTRLQNWETFSNFVGELAVDANNDGVSDSTLIGLATPPDVLWEALFLSRGGNPNDPNSFSPNSNAWQSAMQDFSQILRVNRHSLRTSRTAATNPDAGSEVVRFVHNDFGGLASLPGLKRSNPDWVLLPAPGTAALPPLDTTVLAVKKSSAEREAAAWEFVKWLVSPDTMRAVFPLNALTPLRKSVAYTGTEPEVQEFARQIERMKFPTPVSQTSPHCDDLTGQLKLVLASTGAEL
ncbi:MAG: extracellular solute-binding protein [Candidatus Hydrogenedentes bacterium]|nr:extracellular solute-binding protein [Candidatus Hydrogenedentota bacterium]